MMLRSWQTWWHPVRAALLVTVIVELIAVGVLLSRPFITGWMIDLGLHQPTLALLAWPTAALGLSWIVRASLSEARERLLLRVNTGLAGQVRQDLLRDALSARGETTNRLADGETYANHTPRLLIETWSVMLRMGLGAVLLASIHPDVLLATVPALVLGLVLVWSGRRINVVVAGALAEAKATERSRWHEINHAHGAWLPPGWQSWMGADLERRVAERTALELRLALVTGWWQPAMAGAVAGGVVLILLAGADRVAHGELSPGGLAAGIFMVFLTLGPLLELVSGVERWATVAAAWQRIAPRKLQALVSSSTSHAEEAGIHWSELVVNWPSGAQIVLPSGAVPVGGRLVISGPSGVGKSTLLRCLAGVQPVHKGSIKKSSQPILLSGDARLPPWPISDFLAATVASVGSSVTNADLRRIANHLQLDDCIAQGSAGYQTRGDQVHGTPMSQAVALLAAHLGGRPLLLDEATSTFAPTLAERVLRRLAHTGVTLIVVTHRPQGLSQWPQLLWPTPVSSSSPLPN